MRDSWNAWGDTPEPIPAPKDGTLSLLWMKLRRLAGTRPTAIDDHEGQLRYERDGDVDGKAYLARYLAGGTYEWKELTAAGGSGGTIEVQEGGVKEDDMTILNYDGTDFNVTNSPAGTANISLAYGTSANTPAEGNHTHDYLTHPQVISRLWLVG